MNFKLPSILPQDLQFIQDIVGEIPLSTPPLRSSKSASPVPLLPVADDSIDSSDESDADSEKEVEADILAGVDDEDVEDSPVKTEPSDSASDSDSDSSSDIDPQDEEIPFSLKHDRLEDAGVDDDEDGAGAAITPDQVRTKNEVMDLKVNIPSMQEVGEHEVLEKVGEIMSIIDKVVIVKGVSSEVQNRANERALDSDTLLVFEDRKVLGYIWETFGPTSQPFYRVQFNDTYPLDPEKIRVSREVFHIPAWSNFVFMNQLKLLKGSDASNAHDEEPGEDELEFSDDEAEREHKRALKERRTGSEFASRHSTPVPSRMRDQEAAEDLYGASPYDNPYNDMDFGAGPSRPKPMPYDDPYSDSYGLPESKPSGPSVPEPSSSHHAERPRGRGRGKGPARDGGSRDHGRGGPYDRRRGGDRGRGRGRGRDTWSSSTPQRGSDEYESRHSRSFSPTSMAIARATGQYVDGSSFGAQQAGAPSGDAYWASQQQYPGQYGPDYGYVPPFVQPHINPRFASAFAMSFGFQAQSPYLGYNQHSAGYGQADGNEMSGNWSADWGAQNNGSTAEGYSGGHAPE